MMLKMEMKMLVKEFDEIVEWMNDNEMNDVLYNIKTDLEGMFISGEAKATSKDGRTHYSYDYRTKVILVTWDEPLQTEVGWINDFIYWYEENTLIEVRFYWNDALTEIYNTFEQEHKLLKGSYPFIECGSTDAVEVEAF